MLWRRPRGGPDSWHCRFICPRRIDVSSLACQRCLASGDGARPARAVGQVTRRGNSPPLAGSTRDGRAASFFGRPAEITGFGSPSPLARVYLGAWHDERCRSQLVLSCPRRRGPALTMSTRDTVPGRSSQVLQRVCLSQYVNGNITRDIARLQFSSSDLACWTARTVRRCGGLQEHGSRPY